MTFFRRTHVPDSEFIAGVRRQIAFLDRFRLWWILLNLSLLAVVIWLATDAIRLLINVVAPANAALPILGFGTGIAIGSALGFIIHQLCFNLITAFGPFRSERLLLDYYDMINEGSDDRDALPESDTEL